LEKETDKEEGTHAEEDWGVPDPEVALGPPLSDTYLDHREHPLR